MINNQKTFDLSNGITIECETYETRYSWGHKAYLLINGVQKGYKKIIYYNRTWESYTYQSILRSIIATAPVKNKKKLQELCDKIGSSKDKQELKTLATIAKIGDIISPNKKESNNWKARMLQAGTNGAITLPDNWNKLTEAEKQKRLNKAINIL